MAIIAIGTLSPFGAPVLRSNIITGSVKVTECDSLKAVSGFLSLGTTGVLVFGHAASIVSNKGVGMLTTGVAGSAIGSFAGAFTVASDNTTVAMIRATCDISKETLYSAGESAAIGTTTGSNLMGYSQDLSTEALLSEGSALTTTGQYMGWGVDPNNSANAVVNIYESVIFGV